MHVWLVCLDVFLNTVPTTTLALNGKVGIWLPVVINPVIRHDRGVSMTHDDLAQHIDTAG